MEENTQVCKANENPKIKETKIYLENEKISKEKYVLLKNFHDLGNQLNVLQKDLKEMKELHDDLKEYRYDFRKNNVHLQKDYED